MHHWLAPIVGLLFIPIDYARREGRLLNLPYYSTVEGAVAGFILGYIFINLAEGRWLPIPA